MLPLALFAALASGYALYLRYWKIRGDAALEALVIAQEHSLRLLEDQMCELRQVVYALAAPHLCPVEDEDEAEDPDCPIETA